MGRFIDLTGREFGRLKVIGVRHEKAGLYIWECICECGNRHTVNTRNLLHDYVKSCGCLRIRKDEISSRNQKMKVRHRSYKASIYYRRFLGVTISSKNTFMAKIWQDGKRIYIGSYDNAADAARAYDKKSKELFGEYAVLNFPDEHEGESETVLEVVPEQWSTDVSKLPQGR